MVGNIVCIIEIPQDFRHPSSALDAIIKSQNREYDLNCYHKTAYKFSGDQVTIYQTPCAQALIEYLIHWGGKRVF